MRKVAVFIHEGVELLDFAGPGEVFAATEGFEVFTVAADADPIVSQGFVKVIPRYTVADAPRADIVVLPGGNTQGPLGDDRVIDWVRRSAGSAEVMLSVCSGAFLLGEAGLLDGRHATTWHGSIDKLRRQVPGATVLADTRWVDNGRIVTTAGVSAGIDGALHVVARLLGDDVAAATARYMEYDSWTPGRGTVVQ